MKSIKTKFITFTLVIILLCTALIGGITINNMSALSNSDSAAILNLLVQKGASDIDGILGRTEQSVTVLAGSIDDYIATSGAHISDTDFFDKLSAYIQPLMLNAANVTDSCIGVYIRYSTELAAADSGIFYTRASENEALTPFPCTDISLYEQDDIEHVGWYYIPRDAGEAVWMQPYYNKNTGTRMISYIIPLYADNNFIGIIGFDIDFSMLEEKIAGITAYETGQAYLADQSFNIIYHPDLPAGTTPDEENIVFAEVYDRYTKVVNDGNLYHYNYGGVNKVYTYRTLKNGQNLCIAVPESDINGNLNRTIAHIGILAVLAAIVFVIITIIMCNTITKPLKRLTSAAMKIAKGNLDIDINVHTADEVGVLADTLQKTTDELNVYVQKINRLAYLDTLTGVENKTSYDAAVAELEKKIESGSAEFAVAVLDLNDLKKTNDTRGHYYGDMLITNAAKTIENAFTGCPVYRIGGDEFTVIFEGLNYANRTALCRKFDSALVEQMKRSGEKHLAIAYGIADYSPEDKCYSDVFTRADNAMYENKKMIKTEVD